MRANPFEGLAKGTYILILQLSRKTKIRIGKLGTFNFKAGYYAYVGSAQGPGGLAARLNHHAKIATRPRWHIDYLRKMTTLEEVWYTESNDRLEHFWAQILDDAKGAELPVAKFGSSDCTCVSHLFYFPQVPEKPLLNHKSYKSYMSL